MKESMQSPQGSETVVELLWELWRNWRVRSKTVETDITSEQYRLLKHMSRFGSLSVSALAEYWGVSASAMSIAMRRLEHTGYVSRVRSENDQRTVKISVTESGRQAWQRWHTQRIHSMVPAVERLSPEDQNTLRRLLQTLVDEE
jgi:DNA-binding MarR family transcriptional regulator